MFIRQEDFYQRLNDQVFKPVLRRSLTFKQVQDIVNGIADIILEITIVGDSVRLGKLGTFKTHVMSKGMKWNPQKKKKVKFPERRKVAFYMSKIARQLFYDN